MRKFSLKRKKNLSAHTVMFLKEPLLFFSKEPSPLFSKEPQPTRTLLTFLFKTLATRKRALYSRKRTLNPCKRALYPRKKALLNAFLFPWRLFSLNPLEFVHFSVTSVPFSLTSVLFSYESLQNLFLFP